MTRHYYALEWGQYGITSNENGMRIANYYKFSSKKARDEWVANGPDNINGEWRREAVAANDSELRQVTKEGYLYDGDAELRGIFTEERIGV